MALNNFTRQGNPKKFEYLEAYASQLYAENDIDSLNEFKALLQAKLDQWNESFIGTGSTNNPDTRLQNTGKIMLDNIVMDGTRDFYTEFKNFITWVNNLSEPKKRRSL